MISLNCLARTVFFCKGPKLQQDLWSRYIFPEDDEIPEFIAKQLQVIETEWGSGSVVAITGFNQFKEEYTNNNSLTEQTLRAIACNFFEAIWNEELIIEVQENNEKTVLDKGNLEKVLDKYKDNKRSTDSFLSGSKAYEALQTLISGRTVRVDTTIGPIEIYLHYPVTGGKTHLDICRNGMWITSDIPMLKSNKFSELETFHALIPLRLNGEFYQLVKKSETPLHNKLNIASKDKDTWKKIMRAIKEKLHQEVAKLSSDSFRPADFLTFDKGEIGAGGYRSSVSGTPTAVSEGGGDRPTNEKEASLDQSDSENCNKGGRRKDSAFKRGGNLISFRALPFPIDIRKSRIVVVPQTTEPNSEIRFALEEGVNAMSDGATTTYFVQIIPESLRLNGQHVANDCLCKDKEGRVLGVSLGGLEKDKEFALEMEYSTKHLNISDKQPVVLKTEILRRKPPEKSD